MLTKLRTQNFKSWQDTGMMPISPIMGLFGKNSAGKTSILQLLLMCKKTVESSDIKRVIDTGNDDSYVNLGSYYDIIYNHQRIYPLRFSFSWKLPEIISLSLLNTESTFEDKLLMIDSLTFEASISFESSIVVQEFAYSFQCDRGTNYKFGMKRQRENEYQLIAEGYSVKSIASPSLPLPNPIKSYDFPKQTYLYYYNATFLTDLVLELEKLWQNLYYLGPLREYPKRSYYWTGTQPQDVGKRGELAIPALLASRTLSGNETLEINVAEALQKLGIIHDFSLLKSPTNSYQLLVKPSPNSPEVLITDVGFGVSQILPVLVLCYYTPVGSTIILEQPEIHLHPSAQAGLADIFIDVIKTRNIQIIVESHSEHLLRRLQRRIAEEKQGFSQADASLYFCQMDQQGTSQLIPLELDDFGNINNWPVDFFGDEMGELVAMTEAAMKRRFNN